MPHDHAHSTAPAEVRRPTASAGCDGCAIARRDAIRLFGVAAAGALAALGASAAEANAAPLRFVTALARAGDEVTYAIPGEDGARIDRENAAMITRWQGVVYVHSLGCPHQNTALHWRDTPAGFECPKHHSAFEPNGTHIPGSGRATRGLDRLPVRRDADTIVASLDRVLREDDDAAAWREACVVLAGATR